MSKKQQKVTEAAEVKSPEADQIEQVIPEKSEPTQEEKYAELNDRFLRSFMIAFGLDEVRKHVSIVGFVSCFRSFLRRFFLFCSNFFLRRDFVHQTGAC